MNEKITLQDLIDLLVSQQSNMGQADVDTFVRAFWETIEEGLLSDGIVKVKGLGTFKLVGVESRESINVNTGERFEIQQHSKITFMADSSMRNIINKPFAHFESVILNEGTTFDDIEENVVGESLPEQLKDAEPDVCNAALTLENVEGKSDALVKDELESVKNEEQGNSKVNCDGLSFESEMPSAETDTAAELEQKTIIPSEAKESCPDDRKDDMPDNGNPLLDGDVERVQAESGVSEQLSTTELVPDNQDSQSCSLEDLDEDKNAEVKEERNASFTDETETEDESNQKDISIPENYVGNDNEEKIETELAKQSKIPVQELIISEEKNVEASDDCSEKCPNKDAKQNWRHQDNGTQDTHRMSGRKLLLVSIVTLLILVVVGNVVFYYVLQENKQETKTLNNSEIVSTNHVNPKVNGTSAQLPQALLDEKEKQEEASTEYKELKQTGKDKLQVVSSNVSEKQSSQGRKVLKTRVEGQETTADTLEYEMVGILSHDTIRSGDTLAKYAFKYYGNRRLWQYIAAYNKSVIKDPNNVPIGTVVRIPKLETKKEQNR